MSKYVAFGLGVDITRSANGRLTLHSDSPIGIGSKAAPDAKGEYHVSLTPPQSAVVDAIIEDGKSTEPERLARFLAAVKAGRVELPTGQRGKPSLPRLSLAATIATATAAVDAAAAKAAAKAAKAAAKATPSN